MISSEDKRAVLELIDEAVCNGSRLIPACEAADIAVSTYRRWKNRENLTDQRQFAKKICPFELTDEEQQKIIDVCCEDEYKDETPYTIFVKLLEAGIYIASIRSFYRVLGRHGLTKHRSCKHPGVKHSRPPQKVATAPNQVWTWDITWLPTYVKGLFFYLYTIIDIWDKSIVGWAIHEAESDEYAAQLFSSTLYENRLPSVHIHSDNGNPMKGISLLTLLNRLDLVNSYSRPRVSNDNPFIESFFGTLKNHRKYPGKFNSISEAREWAGNFISYYHNHHRHSGINYFTPHQMRSGEYIKLTQIRNDTLTKALAEKPDRWRGRTPKLWNPKHIVILNPENKQQQMEIYAKQKMLQLA
ncbi:MAG: IS3 family transposase [Spirochaetales bacterium]|nr:IS3 family transposase [Spirochaetales bacterium]